MDRSFSACLRALRRRIVPDSLVGRAALDPPYTPVKPRPSKTPGVPLRRCGRDLIGIGWKCLSADCLLDLAATRPTVTNACWYSHGRRSMAWPEQGSQGRG